MSQIEKLLSVQEVDVRIRELERELKDIPARKAEEEARLSGHKEALAKSQEGLKAHQADLKKLELESQACKEKIQKLRQQQMTLKTNKEFKAMESEIDTIQGEIGGIEERELVIMERVEEARQLIAMRERELKEEESVVLADVVQWDDRLSDVSRELEVARAERAEAVQGVNPEWLKRYETVMTRRDRALVPLEDGVCGGCHMKLPPYVAHVTKRANEMVSCEFCGRMLY